MKFLVVEDEKTSAKFVERALESYGTVTSTDCSEKGFDLFMKAFEEGAPFDAICLDINLPGLDGTELLDEIRQIEEDNGIVGSAATKILVTTATCSLQAYTDASTAGCTSFLCKPLSKAKLLSEFRRLGLIAAD